MNRMEAMVARTMDRMRASEVYRWNAVIVPAAATLTRGVYFVGGPEVVEARDADGRYLGSIVAAAL